MTDILTLVQDPDNWKFNFYVINRRQEFVYGFDDRREADRYAGALNRRHHHKGRFHVMAYSDAMDLSATLTPNYEENWTENYVEPEAVLGGRR